MESWSMLFILGISIDGKKKITIRTLALATIAKLSNHNSD